MIKKQILKYFPSALKELLENEDFPNLEEIRLRADRQCIIELNSGSKRLPYKPTQAELEQTLQLISRASEIGRAHV